MDPRTPALEEDAEAAGDLKFRTEVRRDKNGVLKDSHHRHGSLFPRSLWEGWRKCGEPVCSVYTDLIPLVWQAKEFTQARCMNAQRSSAGKSVVKLRLRLTPLRHWPSIWEEAVSRNHGNQRHVIFSVSLLTAHLNKKARWQWLSLPWFLKLAPW